MRLALVILLLWCIVEGDSNELAAIGNDAVGPSNRALGRSGTSFEGRGDWYNEVGFPQQFFGSRLLMFKIWLFYMLAFLKIFLVWGIWGGQQKEEEVDLSTLYTGGYGYGHGHDYYGYPSSWHYG